MMNDEWILLSFVHYRKFIPEIFLIEVYFFLLHPLWFFKSIIQNKFWTLPKDEFRVQNLFWLPRTFNHISYDQLLPKI